MHVLFCAANTISRLKHFLQKLFRFLRHQRTLKTDFDESGVNKSEACRLNVYEGEKNLEEMCLRKNSFGIILRPNHFLKCLLLKIHLFGNLKLKASLGIKKKKKKLLLGEFPGGLEVRSLVSLAAWVQSLVGELRSHKPHFMAKKENKSFFWYSGNRFHCSPVSYIAPQVTFSW